MTEQPNLIKIGELVKYTLSEKGISEGRVRLSVTIDDEFPDYIFLNMEGIFVPFFVKNYSWKQTKSSACCDVSFDDVIPETLSSQNIPVYVEKCFVNSDDDYEMTDIIGYKVMVEDKIVGEITDINSMTTNELFVVTTSDNEEILIPVAEEFVVSIDDEQKIIKLELPDGLLELNI